MPWVAICFGVALIFLLLAILLSLPAVPADQTASWRGLPFLIGVFFLALALALRLGAQGG